MHLQSAKIQNLGGNKPQHHDQHQHDDRQMVKNENETKENKASEEKKRKRLEETSSPEITAKMLLDLEMEILLVES